MSKCTFLIIYWAILLVLPIAVKGQAGNGFVCVSAGRFPDPTSCSRYYSCFLDPISGNLLLSLQTCPGTSIFNPATAKCTIAGGSYSCTPTTTTASTTTTTTTTTATPVTTPTSTTTLATTATTITTSEKITTPRTTTTRKTTTPKTTTTKRTTTPKTTSTSTTSTTPKTTIAMPATTAATTISLTTTRQTPVTTPVTITTTTAAPTTVTAKDTEGCTSPGRFPEPTDCSRYYSCFRDPATGELIRSNYTCPGTSIFNPATSKCTASGGSFTCTPTTTPTTTTESTTTSSTTTTTTESTTTTTEPTTTTSPTTTTTTTTTAAPCNANGFTCPTSTSFQLCSAGQPIGSPIPCSSGLFCSESCSLFCVEDVSTC